MKLLTSHSLLHSLSLGCSYRSESALAGFMCRYLDQVFPIATLHSSFLWQFCCHFDLLKFDLLRLKELAKACKTNLRIYVFIFVIFYVKSRGQISQVSHHYHCIRVNPISVLIPKCVSDISSFPPA